MHLKHDYTCTCEVIFHYGKHYCSPTRASFVHVCVILSSHFVGEFLVCFSKKSKIHFWIGYEVDELL